MIETMLEGLKDVPDLVLHHLNFRLSRDHEDIGAWRFAKVIRVLWFALRAVALRLRQGCDTLYYVPAPGKRGALYRDWIIMALCRPFFRHLVLHWHASGLTAWLDAEAHPLERSITRFLLGRADLALIVSPSLRQDADALRARRVVVAANGVPTPPGTSTDPAKPGAPYQSLFLGLCSEEKGLFAAAEAVLEANRLESAPNEPPRFTLVAAGPFPDAATEQRFQQLVHRHPAVLRQVGFADENQKRTLFARSHCLLFPTRYAAEGLPLVVLEALAHDLPVIATHWRGLPDAVTPECGRLVPPGELDALTRALLDLRASPPPPGACRARFLRDYTVPLHLARLTAALRQLQTPIAKPRESRA